jgi:hypothetical protein
MNMSGFEWSVSTIAPEESAERILIVLLIDGSSSMKDVDTSIGTSAPKFQSVAEAVDSFFDSGLEESNPDLLHKGEVAVGVFSAVPARPVVRWKTSGSSPATPFQFIARMSKITSEAPSGGTPLGESLLEALDVIARRKSELRAAGLSHACRPMLYVLTDGQPTTDTTAAAIRALIDAEAAKKVLFFVMGIGDADQNVLAQELGEHYYPLKGRPISLTMEFLSKSAGRAIADPDADASAIHADIRDEYNDHSPFS